MGDFDATLNVKLNDLKADNLKKYDVVLFYGSGGNFNDAAQEEDHPSKSRGLPADGSGRSILM